MKKAIYKLGIIITLLLTVVVCNNVNASNYYWVGGSGNWTDFSNHWATTSGGGTFQLSPPSSSDNVFFDANSFTSTGQTVTIDFDANCNNMDWTGATNSPTLDGPSYINLYIYGSLTLPTGGMTITFTGTLNFESSSSGNTITSNGKTWQSTVTFGGSGVWTIQDAFATTQAVNFQNGTLTVNNQDFSCYNFETNGGTSGTLNIVSSTFHIENEWNFDPFASVSFNATSSNIIFTGSAWTLWGAGHTFYNITATNTTGSGRLNDNNTFHDLTFAGLVNFNGTETCNDVTVANTGTGNLGSNSTFHNVTLNGDGSFGDGNSMNNLVLNAGHTYIFSGGGTQTITGTLTANGSCSSLITMYSGSPGNQGIISVASGTVALSYVSLQDIYTTGGATFSATNALDLGDNGGLTITTLSSRNLYWVGNSGSWSDASHWSLTSGGSPVGCPPLYIDNVFFDANSFSSTGQTVTIDVTTASCNNMNWTGTTNTPTLGGSSSNSLVINGSLTFPTGGLSMGFTGVTIFASTTTGQTITSNGKSFSGSVIFNGAGGGWIMQDAFATTQNLSLLNGTLTVSNKSVTCNNFNFSASGSSVLNMVSSVFQLSGSWSASHSGATLNAASSSITLTNASSTFTGGAFTYGNVTFNGDGYVNGGNNTFANLNFSPNHIYKLQNGSTQTISGSLSATGTCTTLIAIGSDAPGNVVNISVASGTISLSYVSLMDIHAIGGATFTATNTQDLGDNSGWSITGVSSRNLYWIGNGGNWSDVSHWSLTSGGSPVGCPPTYLDNLFFDANSFSTSNQTVTINVNPASCNNMDWTGVTNNPTLGGSTELDIYGSLTLPAGAMTLGFSGNTAFKATSTGKTVTSNGKSFSGNITFSGTGGGWTLQDALTTTQGITLNNGTLTTSNLQVNCTDLTVSGAFTLNATSSTFQLSGSWSNNSGALTINGTPYNINLSGSDAQFNGGGYTYYNVNFTSTSGTAHIVGYNNTFHNVVFSGDGKFDGPSTFDNLTFSPGHTYTFTAFNTVTINTSLNATGTSGSMINITSDDPFNNGSLSMASGAVCLDYVNISSNYASGGADFNAGVHSVDQGNNSGWIFPAPLVATTASGAGNTQFTAHWNSVSWASTYLLDISTSNTFNTFVTASSITYNHYNVGNVLTKTITGLTQGTTYYYRIVEVNNCGTDVTSNTISASTTITPCAGIAGGTVTPSNSVICSSGSQLLTETGASGGTLQWQMSADNIHWSDVNGATNNTYSTAAATQRYYYRCQTIAACFNVSSTTAAVDISATPTLTITNVTSSSATVTWAPYGIGQYDISWSGAAGSGSASGVTTNNFSITGLTPNGDLLVTVTPTTPVCSGVTLSSLGTHTLCAAPTVTSITATTFHGFKVNWTTVTGATSYRVYYRDLGTQSSWSFVDTAGTAKTVAVPYGGHKYAVYVAAKNCPSPGNIGDGSSIGYVSTNPGSSCGPVPTVSASSSCPNQIHVDIAGTPPFNLILRRISPGLTAGASYPINTNSVDVTVGTKYAGDIFEIFATKSCGAGVPTSIVSNVFDIAVKPGCPAVSNLVLSHPTCNGFTASWNADDCAGLGISGYQLLIKKNGSLNYNGYPVGTSTHDVVGWLPSGTVYNVVVMSISCNGSSSAYSLSDTISTVSCGRTEEQEETIPNTTDNDKESVTIYPNPTQGQFWIDLGRRDNSEATVKIELVNQLGQVITTYINTATTGKLHELINTPEGIAAGIYFVRTSVNGNVYVNRLMISKE